MNKLLTQKELDALPPKEQQNYIDRVFFGKVSAESVIEMKHEVEDFPRRLKPGKIPEGMI